jgi:hypothetical protein
VRRRRNVCQEEAVWDMEMRIHSGERRTAHVHWKEKMGRYGKAYIVYVGDILDTG